MPPEHEQMEADWLAAELKRCAEYARGAYEKPSENDRRLDLANLIGSLDTLYEHYKPYTTPHQPEPQEAPRNPSWFDFSKRR